LAHHGVATELLNILERAMARDASAGRVAVDAHRLGGVHLAPSGPA
jgi:hypothetical protein